MASTVTRIARANASWPSVASRPARWGSSEVWIAWKSCSGARVISSALKTTPASAVRRRRADGQHRALSSVCSASWIAGHRQREAGARAQRQRALVDRPPARRPARVAHDRPRHDEQRGQRRGEDAQRDRRLPAGEARPRRRPGSRSARPTRRARARRRGRTTGGRRGSRGRSSSRRRPASRRRRSSTASPSRRRPRSGRCSASATTRKAAAKPAWTSSGIAQRVPAVVAARAAVGDRARQQLLDRPVDDRDDDEQDRPQQRDRAVGVGVRARGWRPRSRRR